MLTSTYIHGQGIGEATERRIWEAGGLDWQEFLVRESELPLSSRQRAVLVPLVEQSIERLREEDCGFFARSLAPREHWRAYPQFRERMAFLDIETTGMGMESAITVIGLYDGTKVKSFIKGFNMEEFEDEIAKYDLLVTFFGTGFDLPHIRHRFPGIQMTGLHIDLCPLLRRLSLKGGLKSVEKQLGIARSQETVGLDGWDAVRLWREWEWGSRESLDLLIEYNREDIVNLAALLDYGYNEMRKRCFPYV